jgi:hypothetical protein
MREQTLQADRKALLHYPQLRIDALRFRQHRIAQPLGCHLMRVGEEFGLGDLACFKVGEDLVQAHLQFGC